MFRFPWSNFHELNLDWILEVVKEAKEIFINGEGDIQHAVETSEQALDVAEQAAAAVIADGSITIPKLNNEVLKTTAYVIVGNRADEAVPAGAYVYLRNSLVSGLVDGIYTAAVNIPAGALVTPAEFQQSTELHDSGSLNVLKNTLTQLDDDKAEKTDLTNISQDGSTCDIAAGIPAGTYFYRNGVLKRARALIQQGNSFTDQNSETVTAGGLNGLNSFITSVDNRLKIQQTYTANDEEGFLKQVLDYALTLGAGNYVMGITWQYNYFCNVSVTVQSSTRCVASVFPQPGNKAEFYVCECNNGTYTYKKCALSPLS